ncbi:MAG TPA: hypothetical protein DCP28_36565, partial [Cytophagales bacterium]|nr:hypothetical protein [Cytophagales bacterium]
MDARQYQAVLDTLAPNLEWIMGHPTPSKYPMNIANRVGLALDYLGYADSAYYWYKQGYGIAEQLKKYDVMVNAEENIAIAYRYAKRWDSVVVAGERALDLLMTYLPDTGQWERSTQITVLWEVYNGYRQWGIYSEAIRYADAYVRRGRDWGWEETEGYGYGLLGEAYQDAQEPERALEYLNQGLAMAEARQDSTAQNWFLAKLGAYTLELGQYPTAVGHYLRALDLYQPGKQKNLPLYYANLALAYTQLGQAKEALAYTQKTREHMVTTDYDIDVALQIDLNLHEARAYALLGQLPR